MTLFHERQPAPLVRIQRQCILQHVDNAPLVVHHFFQRHEVGVDSREAAVHLAGDFEPVARPQQVVHVPGRGLFQRSGAGVLRRDFARRMLPGDLRDTVVYHLGFLRVRQARVECQHVGHMGVCVLRGQLPTDLQDGPVNLYSEEILRFPRDGEGRPECDDAVDVRHCRPADIGVAAPRSVALP